VDRQPHHDGIDKNSQVQKEVLRESNKIVQRKIEEDRRDKRLKSGAQGHYEGFLQWKD